eukprot:15440735-Alexandrium_andersonii.AAC.1
MESRSGHTPAPQSEHVAAWYLVGISTAREHHSSHLGFVRTMHFRHQRPRSEHSPDRFNAGSKHRSNNLSNVLFDPPLSAPGRPPCAMWGPPPHMHPKSGEVPHLSSNMWGGTPLMWGRPPHMHLEEGTRGFVSQLSNRHMACQCGAMMHMSCNFDPPPDCH